MNFLNLHIALMISVLLWSCGSQKNHNSSDQKTEKDSSQVQHETPDSTAETVTTNNNTTVAVSNNASLSGNDFNFIYATSQKWQGGIKGSGGGVNYEFCLLSLNSSSLLIIDQIWIGQTYHETSASRKFPKTAADGFNTGDTIYIYTSDYIKSPDKIDLLETPGGQKEVPEVKQNTPPPYAYTGEALIGYTLKGIRKYKEIAKITVKSPLFYP
jgi:hypothetical protein